jgi:hypothetical protein
MRDAEKDEEIYTNSICTIYRDIKSINHSTVEIINDRGGNPSYKNIIADDLSDVTFRNYHTIYSSDYVRHIENVTCSKHSIMAGVDILS